MQQLKTWLDKKTLQVPPKTAIGSAIKPFVIGRENWLFSNTRGGAQASAILYSLIETAKANGLQSGPCIIALFEQIPHIKDGGNIDHLLPWFIRL